MLYDDSPTNNTTCTRKSWTLCTSLRFEGRESIWMQQQLEVGNTVYNCQIDSRAISERFHEMLLQRLNTL